MATAIPNISKAQEIFNQRTDQEYASAFVKVQDLTHVELSDALPEFAKLAKDAKLKHLLVRVGYQQAAACAQQFQASRFKPYSVNYGHSVLHLLCNHPDKPQCKYPPANGASFGVTAVILSGDEILVVKDGSSAKFKPITGDVEDGGGDKPAQGGYETALKEIQEEVGLDLRRSPAIKVGEWVIRNFRGIAPNFNSIFAFSVNKNVVQPKIDGQEVTDCKWMKVEDYIRDNQQPTGVPTDSSELENKGASQGSRREWVMTKIVRIAAYLNIPHRDMPWTTETVYFDDGKREILLSFPNVLGSKTLAQVQKEAQELQTLEEEREKRIKQQRKGSDKEIGQLMVKAVAFSGDLTLQRLEGLLEWGADPDVKDEEFDCPAISWAVKGDKEDMFLLLRSYGANLHAVDRQGNSPLYWAKKLGREKLRKHLEDAGLTK